MTRRRTVAGFAALVGVVGALVFGGAIAASANNNLEFDQTTPDTVTAPWSEEGLSLTGTVDAVNGTNPIEIRQGTLPTGGIVCGAATFLTPTTWQCNTSMALGTYTLTAWQYGETPATDRFDTITLNVVVPPAVVTSNPLTVQEGVGFDIQGEHTYPGSTVVVDTLGWSSGTCSTVDDGVASLDTWGCGGPWTNALPMGVYYFPVTQSFGGADESDPVLVQVTVTPMPFAFTAPNPAGDDYTTGLTTISGTTNDLVTPVNVSRTFSPDPDGAVLIPECTNVPVQPDNTWSCAVNFVPEHWDLFASQGALNAELLDYSVYIPAPAILNADPMHVAVSPTATAFFSGTTTFLGTPSSFVRVYFPFAEPYYGPGSQCVDNVITPDGFGGGTWECEIEIWAEDVPWDTDVTYTYQVSQEDLNAIDFRHADHQVVYGNDYPGELAIDPFDADGVLWQDAPFVSISGEAPNGDPVDVDIDGDSSPECIGLAPDFQGQWSCGPVQVDLGSHTVTAWQYSNSVEASLTVFLPEPILSTGDPIVITDDEPLVNLYGTSANGTEIAARIVDTSPYPAPITCTTTTVAENFSDCLLTVDPLSPGTYQLEVIQRPVGGNPDQHSTEALVTLTIVDIPAPTLGNDEDYVLPDDGIGEFFGTTSYIDGSVWVAVETEPETEVMCEDAGPFAPLDVDYGWDCPLDLAFLPDGIYGARIFVEDQIDGMTVTSESTYLQVYVGETPSTGVPVLNCGFTPNGGFTVSSPYIMNPDGFWINRVFLEGGSSYPGESFGLQGKCNGSTGSPFPFDDGNLYFDPIDECDGSCSESGLVPGIYEVYYTVSESELDTTPGINLEPHSYLFTIPEAPAITTVSSTTLSVIAGGTATPHDAVRIVRPNGTQLCATTANAAGNWACQFPRSTTASARAISIDPPSGGLSAYTAARSIPIFVAPVTPVIEEPVSLVSWFLEFGGDLSNLKPGDKFTLTVSGMPVGTEIEVWMHSEPRLLGTAVGTGLPIAMNLQVPEDIESGRHEIEMIAVTPLGTNYFYTSDAMVAGGAPTASDKPFDAVEDPKDNGTNNGPGNGRGGGTADRNDPGAPSGITGTIAPFPMIIDNPAAIAIAGGLALALLFLVALPTELLNSSLSSNTSRLGRVYGAVDGAMTRAQNWLIKVTRSRALVAILLVLIVAVIYGFVDPGFGFDIVSLRLVLSLAIAFFLLSFVASWVSGIIIRRTWGAMAIVALQPSIILFAVVGVIVARILDFSPGFLVGVAIGLELLQASKHVSARAVFVQIAVVTGFALAAWIAYSLFTPGHDFLGLLIEDTMVATTAEGLTGALIAVFPLKFLDGRELWEVSKRLWAAAFLIVGTAFALLVLPTAIQGTDVADFGTWLIVFAVFGAVSFAVWLVFVRADKPASAAEKPKVDA